MQKQVIGVATIALLLAGGGIYYYLDTAAAFAAEEDYTAARDIGDNRRACLAAGQAALEWSKVGNEEKRDHWLQEEEWTCALARLQAI